MNNTRAMVRLVQDGRHRDIDVSLFVPTWNSAPFVVEAIESALGQRDVRAEILVLDDHSDDGTWERTVERLERYRGPHRVMIGRHPRRDARQHHPVVAAQASSQLIVECHGDDVSEPHRAARLFEFTRANGSRCVGTNATRIDRRGRVLGRRVDGVDTGSWSMKRWISTGWCEGFTGSTLAYSPEVIRGFPPLSRDRIAVSLDHVIPFRGLLLGRLDYLNETLVQYRYHPRQHTYRLHLAVEGEERAESVQSLDCMTHLAMLADLDHVAIHGDPETRQRAHRWRPALEARVLKLVDRWVLTRNRLYASGRRGVWMDAERFERRALRHHLLWGRIMRRLSSVFEGDRRGRVSGKRGGFDPSSASSSDVGGKAA